MNEQRNTDGDTFTPSEQFVERQCHKCPHTETMPSYVGLWMCRKCRAINPPLVADADGNPDDGSMTVAALVVLAWIAAALTALLIGLYYAPLWILHFALTVLAVLTARRVERWLKGE